MHWPFQPGCRVAQGGDEVLRAAVRVGVLADPVNGAKRTARRPASRSQRGARPHLAEAARHDMARRSWVAASNSRSGTITSASSSSSLSGSATGPGPELPAMSRARTAPAVTGRTAGPTRAAEAATGPTVANFRDQPVLLGAPVPGDAVVNVRRDQFRGRRFPVSRLDAGRWPLHGDGRPPTGSYGTGAFPDTSQPWPRSRLGTWRAGGSSLPHPPAQVARAGTQSRETRETRTAGQPIRSCAGRRAAPAAMS